MYNFTYKSPLLVLASCLHFFYKQFFAFILIAKVKIKVYMNALTCILNNYIMHILRPNSKLLNILFSEEKFPLTNHEIMS